MKKKVKSTKKLSFKKLEISKLNQNHISGGNNNNFPNQKTKYCTGGASGIYNADYSCGCVTTITSIFPNITIGNN